MTDWAALPPVSGRYLLEGRVGAGGMGVVWRARDMRLDRVVAVKVLRPEFAGRPEFRDLLLREGRLAGQVSHPGVVQVRDYDDGSAGGVPYLVMEYVAGPSLAAVLVTRAGLVMGTPAYLSPERAAGLPATPASDLYGLGMIAYECLTGRPPFQGTPLTVALAHMDRPLPPLPDTVPAPAAELVAALAAKEPQRRPGDALAVAEWARRIREHPQVTRAAPGPVSISAPLTLAEPARGITESPRRRLSRRQDRIVRAAAKAFSARLNSAKSRKQRPALLALFTSRSSKDGTPCSRM